MLLLKQVNGCQNELQNQVDNVDNYEWLLPLSVGIIQVASFQCHSAVDGGDKNRNYIQRRHLQRQRQLTGMNWIRTDRECHDGRCCPFWRLHKCCSGKARMCAGWRWIGWLIAFLRSLAGRANIFDSLFRPCQIFCATCRRMIASFVDGYYWRRHWWTPAATVNSPPTNQSLQISDLDASFQS